MTSDTALILLEDTATIRLAMLLLGPIAAAVFFGYVWSRYRNTDKSYQFESTTDVEVGDVHALDQHVDHIPRTQENRIAGHELTSDPRARIGRR